jgi:16S rRNA (cytidine1402-2'-O)-methyltransferase
MTGQPALVLVATPIGNLGDLTPRAVVELRAANAIACEDTRRTRALLSHAGVPCPTLIVVNDHTEAASVRDVLRRLDEGQRVAVVTDAGTPGISDPGERLVRAAANAGHRVEIAPGASAAIAALVVSGLPTGRFVFEGFLPRKGTARAARLDALLREERTAIVYESPHRIAATINDLANALGASRRVVIARELTKLHEEVWRGSLVDAAVWAASEPPGEFVIVIDGAARVDGPSDDDLVAALRGHIAGGSTKRDAVMAVVDELAVGKRRVYDLANRLG